MSLVHYKFKSSLEYQHVKFDGLHISVGDLKKEIVAQKQLRLGDFELEITNAQTGAAYKNNNLLIPRNTSVIVQRVPAKPCAASSTQKSWEAYKLEVAKAKQQKQLSLEQLKQTPDLANANASEIDKVIAAVAQSNKAFEPSNYVGKHHSGPLPERYLCRRCHQSGHHISSCPRQSDRENLGPHIKRTTGIPNSFLTFVDDPLAPGALLTQHGQFAVPTIDAQAYKEGKKELPPFLPRPKSLEPEKPQIPLELKCRLCNDLMTDAALVPCCGNSYCDECIRDALLETEDHQCPDCGQYGVSPSGIIPNNSLRSAVTAFTNDSGYSKARRRSTERMVVSSQQQKQQIPPMSPQAFLGQHPQPQPPQSPQPFPGQLTPQKPSQPQQAFPSQHPPQKPPQSPQTFPGQHPPPQSPQHRQPPGHLPLHPQSLHQPPSGQHQPPQPQHPQQALPPRIQGPPKNQVPPLRSNAPSNAPPSRLEPQPIHLHPPPSHHPPPGSQVPGAFHQPPPTQPHSVTQSVSQPPVSQTTPPCIPALLSAHDTSRPPPNHVPAAHSSSGHQLQPGSSSQPNTPPAAATIHPHQPPPGFRDERRIRPRHPEAPPVYVSSTLASAESKTGYTPRGRSPQAYEEERGEQVISVVGNKLHHSYRREQGHGHGGRGERIDHPTLPPRAAGGSYRPVAVTLPPQGAVSVPLPYLSAIAGLPTPVIPPPTFAYPAAVAIPGYPVQAYPGYPDPVASAQLPPHYTPRRSRSRSRSRSHSRTRSFKGRSRSFSPRRSRPRSFSRGRSHTPRRSVARSRGSPGPVNKSPVRERSWSVGDGKPRSSARRSQSHSPARRSRSPGRRSRSLTRRSRSPGGKFRSPGKGSVRSQDSKYRSPGRGRSRSFSRARSRSPARRRSRTRSRSHTPLRRKSRSFSPRRRRGTRSPRSRSRDTLRRSRTRSRSRSLSIPRRRSYSASPPRITQPLRPVGPISQRKSASPFRHHSPSPDYRRKGRTPPPGGYQPYRGRSRGRGRGRGFRGDWVTFRPYNDRRQFDSHFIQPAENFIRNSAHYDYYREMYAKFGANTPQPPLPPPHQWAQNSIFPNAHDQVGNPFPPGTHPIGQVHLGWQGQQPLQPQLLQRLVPLQRLPDGRGDMDCEQDRNLCSAEPEPPGVGQSLDTFSDRRDYLRDGQKDFSRDYYKEQSQDFMRSQEKEKPRDQNVDYPREQSRDFNRDTHMEQNKNLSRDQNRESPRDQGRDFSRDQERKVNRDQGRDNQRDKNRECSRDQNSRDQGRESRDHGRDFQRDQGRDTQRDQRRDISRDNRDSRDHQRDNRWRDHRDKDSLRESSRDTQRDGRDTQRETSFDRDRHSRLERESQDRNRNSSEKHTRTSDKPAKDKKKKPDKENVAGKETVSKKKAVKHSSSGDEKAAPVKKVKKTTVVADEKPAGIKKKVLKKKKEVVSAENKDTSDSETPLSSNLIQVTITKDNSKSEKGAKSETKGAAKKVIRRIKKLTATSSGTEDDKAVKHVKQGAEISVKQKVSEVDVPADKIPDTTSKSPEPEVKTELADSTSKVEGKAGQLEKQETMMEVSAEGEEEEPDEGEEKAAGSTDDELMLHPPELSKWERDDYDWESSDTQHPSRKRKIIPEKKMTMLPRSVLNRAETYMAKKPVKPTVATASNVSPGKPQRRVYLEDKQDQGSEEKDERHVKTTKSTSLDMQITITKPEKRSPEQQERTSGQDRHSNEDTRTVKKARDVEEERSQHRKKHSHERHADERHHSTETRSRRDSSSPRRDRDRRHHDREESRRHSRDQDDHRVRDRDDHRDKSEYRERDRDDHRERDRDSHRERDYRRDERHREQEAHHRERDSHRDREEQRAERKASASEKGSTSSAPKDLRHKLEQARNKDVTKKPPRTADRKESVIDEAKFEPDYDELESSESGSEEVMADQHSTVSTEETSDVEHSPAKKICIDSGDEAGKKKHKKSSKHKKNKKKKKNKKQRKEKRHKKDKDQRN